MSNTKAAALNRAFNNADATVAAQAATVADLAADQIAAANKFDVPTLTDAALAKQVMTNMGFLPSTVAAITQLEIELAAYFGGMGKGNRGFVVLQLSDILSGIAATDATYGAIATAWNAEVAASVTASTVNSLQLTTAADVATGGQGDDTFTGTLSGLATALNFNATDKIDGAAGNDTFKVGMNTAFTGFTSGYLKNVENIELTNLGSSNLNFDAAGTSGVTTYTLNSGANGSAITLTNMATGVKTLNVNGLNKADDTVTLTTAFVTGSAENTGTADTLVLNANGVGTSSTYYADLTLGGSNYVTVNSTGTNALNFNGTELTKLTVAGSGKTTVTLTSGSATALTSYDASAATGAVTATLTSVTGTGTLKTIKGGSGADVITFETQDMPANAIISDAGGTDSLTIKSTGGTVEYAMTGFETLNFTGVTTAPLYVSGAKSTDIKTITTAYSATSSSRTQQPIYLVNMGAADLAFEAKGALTDNESTNGDVESDHTGTTTLTYKPAAASAAAYTADNASADYVFSKTSALTVNANAFTVTTGSSVTATLAKTATVNSISGLDLAGDEQTIFNSLISVPAATSFTVNSAAKLGTSAQISGAALTSGTINHSGLVTDAAALDIIAAKLKTLTVTSSSPIDLDNAATNLGVLETLTVDAKAGLADFGDLAKVTSITLSGSTTTSGIRSQVDLGALGGSGNAYDMTLTATGLRGNLNTGNINVLAGYDVTLDVAGTTGNVTFGTIGATAAGDDVTMKAQKATGDFYVGNISATGNVSVLATGTTGTSTVNSVTGKAVTVDVSGTGSATSDVGAITAKTSATVNYNTLKANTSKTIGISEGSTAFTATINGGIMQDTVTITGASTQESITVKGDFGATATDSLTINSTLVAATYAQTIDISGVSNYDVGAITGGSSDDTIVGGAGVDTITGGLGQDTLTGGAGADKFLFNTGDSPYNKPDTITDLGKTDIIIYGGADIHEVDVPVTGVAGTTATISAKGVATFGLSTAAQTDTLAECVALVNKAIGTAGYSAMFDFGGTTYLFIDTDGATTQNTTGVVVKLTGVVIAAATMIEGTSTGLTGWAA